MKKGRIIIRFPTQYRYTIQTKKTETFRRLSAAGWWPIGRMEGEWQWNVIYLKLVLSEKLSTHQFEAAAVTSYLYDMLWPRHMRVLLGAKLS